MKNYLFVLPVLVFAGCSSNTTAVDSSAGGTSSTAPVASGADAIPTPYVADASAAMANSAAMGTTGNTALSNAANNQAAGGTAPGMKMPQVPPGMSMGSSAVLPATPALDKQIAALEKGADKKKLAGLLANRGTLRMNDAEAAPRVKYRAALIDYRRALQLDPTNAEAKANKKQIEDIYKMMGRPVPQ
jgi:tetratricopeptide (TPR) repeat protein